MDRLAQEQTIPLPGADMSGGIGGNAGGMHERREGQDEEDEEGAVGVEDEEDEEDHEDEEDEEDDEEQGDEEFDPTDERGAKALRKACVQGSKVYVRGTDWGKLSRFTREAVELLIGAPPAKTDRRRTSQIKRIISELAGGKTFMDLDVELNNEDENSGGSRKPRKRMRINWEDEDEGDEMPVSLQAPLRNSICAGGASTSSLAQACQALIADRSMEDELKQTLMQYRSIPAVDSRGFCFRPGHQGGTARVTGGTEVGVNGGVLFDSCPFAAANAMMRAAQVQAKGERYTLVDVPRPKVGEGQLLVRIRAAGFCHTDVMVAEGAFDSPFPIIGSHEPAGVVEEVGQGVTDFAVGDRVTSLNHAGTCGKCEDCRGGGDNVVCPNGSFTGLHVDGNFAEYFLAMASRSAKIPDGMSFETAAPLSCAGVTMYGAIKKAALPPGAVLAISGLGALGHIGVQMAKAMGHVTIGIDARDGPIELCKSFELAPDLCIDASKTSVEQAIKELKEVESIGRNHPDGVDAILVTAESKAAISYALSLVKQHGTFVLVSQPETISIPFRELVFRDIRVVGSLQGGRQYLQETVDLVQSKGIVVKTRSWKLDDINEMWDEQLSGGMVGKNVVVF